MEKCRSYSLQDAHLSLLYASFSHVQKHKGILTATRAVHSTVMCSNVSLMKTTLCEMVARKQNVTSAAVRGLKYLQYSR